MLFFFLFSFGNNILIYYMNEFWFVKKCVYARAHPPYEQHIKSFLFGFHLNHVLLMRFNC